MPTTSTKMVHQKQAEPLNEPDTYITTIDLPGETVQFWRSTKTVRVVLRKHRDVLFDIQLFKGMAYTVEAEQSDFYDADAKKIYLPKRRLTFRDGQRVHLWISREFKGSLILKANEKILGRFEPNKLDPATHDVSPTTKPAPLIIVWHNDAAAKPLASTAASLPDNRVVGSPETTEKSATDAWADSQIPQMTLPLPEQLSDGVDQIMHVIEVRPDDPKMPADISAYFKKGGESTAIDTNGQITRNWLWGTIAGTAAYLDDNRHWVKELWRQKFYIQKVVHKKAGPKWYIVFKGNQKLRQYFTASRYGVTHSKVLSITSGVGSTAGLRHGAWEPAHWP